jgi:HK97 gp10 family phage protein
VQTGGGIVIDHKLDFSGLLDISRDMELLSKAENKKVLRDGTRAGAEVLKEEVIKRAPERTGKLKRNVVVVTKRAAEMRSRPVHIRGVNPETGNSDNTMKASNRRNAFYWRFVELGTSNMPAHPLCGLRLMRGRKKRHAP